MGLQGLITGQLPIINPSEEIIARKGFKNCDVFTARFAPVLVSSAGLVIRLIEWSWFSLGRPEDPKLMNNPLENIDQQPLPSPAAELNRGCFCVTLNNALLQAKLASDPVTQDLARTHPHLFSTTSVFISSAHVQQMQQLISVVTRVVNLPGFKRHTEGEARLQAGAQQPLGVFMGYDFHLGEKGPQLIEINTNAGGAFLNALLRDAQSKCCRSAQDEAITQEHLQQEFYAMFQHEWQLARGDQPLKTIAIIDAAPEQQYLYPEFKLAQAMFARMGLTALIADPAELIIQGQALCIKRDGFTHRIDLVYNRLTDFTLKQAHQALLRKAYEDDLAVITPNPALHARYADKRNLCALSDETALRAMGLPEQEIQVLLTTIPATRIVEPEQAAALWGARKQLFFKPWAGFGGKAAYRGDKITQRIWREILQGNYVAQQLIPPSERGIMVDDQPTALKMDIRAYVYAGRIQLLAARLYQGQTTNFRTPGGGFAPVYAMSS